MVYFFVEKQPDDVHVGTMSIVPAIESIHAQARITGLLFASLRSGLIPGGADKTEKN